MQCEEKKNEKKKKRVNFKHFFPPSIPYRNNNWLNTIYCVVFFTVNFFLFMAARQVIITKRVMRPFLSFFFSINFIGAATSAVHYHTHLPSSRTIGRDHKARLHAKTRTESVLAGHRGCRATNASSHESAEANRGAFRAFSG